MRGALVCTLFFALTCLSLTSDAEDKLGEIVPALRAADTALTPIKPIVLNIRYANGVYISETLTRARKNVANLKKLIDLRDERGLGLADEFLLFTIMSMLRDDMSSLSDALRNVDGAFDSVRPNSLAGEWNVATSRSLTPLSTALTSLDEDLYARLQDADRRLSNARRK